MKSLLTALQAIFFMLLFSVTMVYADDCSVGRTPEGVYPMDDNDIVMVSEDIKVDVKKGFVECNFVFKNTGKEKDVLMGFPAKMEDEGDNTMEENLYLNDFKSFTGENEIPVQMENGVKPKDLKDSSYPFYSAWYTFSVHFNEGETKTIKNTYSVKFTAYSTGETRAGYILKTGAFWKDPIGHAKVTFDLGDIEPYRLANIYPYSMSFEGKNKLVWEKSNFEPDFDLEVMYHSYYYTKEYFEEMSEEKNEALAEVEAFKKLDKELDKLSEDELLNYYSQYKVDEKPAIAKYILSKMSKGIIPEESPVIKDLSLEVYNEGSNSYIVNGKFEDVNGDFISARLKFSHIENGQTIVDFDEVRPIGDYMTKFLDDESFKIDLLPNINYDLEFSVTDSQDNIATKKMKYPNEPVEKNESESKITDEETINEEIRQDDSKNVEVTQSKTENEETVNAIAKEKRIPKELVIGGSIAVLIILIVVFTLVKKKKDIKG